MPIEYRVEIRPSARRELESIPFDVRQRLLSAIGNLGANPRPRGCRKLVSSPSDFRLRVGDYRVLYEVLEREGVVLVYRVRHRSKAYRL